MLLLGRYQIVEAVMKFNDLGNWFKTKGQNISSFINESKIELSDKLNQYLESDAYEEDLDKLLKDIYSKFYKDLCYDHVEDRKVRIKLKEDQIKKKSAIAIGEGAVYAGLSVATKLPEPNTVTSAVGIGAGTQITLISSSAVTILIKRSLNGYEVKSHDPEFS